MCHHNSLKNWRKSKLYSINHYDLLYDGAVEVLDFNLILRICQWNNQLFNMRSSVKCWTLVCSQSWILGTSLSKATDPISWILVALRGHFTADITFSSCFSDIRGWLRSRLVHSSRAQQFSYYLGKFYRISQWPSMWRQRHCCNCRCGQSGWDIITQNRKKEVISWTGSWAFNAPL